MAPGPASIAGTGRLDSAAGAGRAAARVPAPGAVRAAGYLTGGEGGHATRSYRAHGNGGQRLYVFPDLDLVVVTTVGRYDTRDERVDQVVLDEAVLPVLER